MQPADLVKAWRELAEDNAETCKRAERQTDVLAGQRCFTADGRWQAYNRCADALEQVLSDPIAVDPKIAKIQKLVDNWATCDFGAPLEIGTFHYVAAQLSRILTTDEGAPHASE